MATEAAPPQEATKRLQTKKQTLDDAYAPPANYLEIDVGNPMTHGVARKRYTDYEVRMRVSRNAPRRLGLQAPALRSATRPPSLAD